MKFTLINKDSNTKARRGELELAHGKVQTPIFMPVGTVGSVKAVSNEELEELGAEIILGNTYHLELRPGSKFIKDNFGDLHNFTGWQKPILTDSGGFQVFSLGLRPEEGESERPRLAKITEEGVVFQSFINGDEFNFTPELVIGIQRNLGSDIIMALDVCTEYPATYERTKEAMELTHRWEKRGIEYWEKTQTKLPRHFAHRNDNAQAYFGIIQGGTYDDLREESAKYISSLPFDGIAIGGVAVGEGKEATIKAVDVVEPHLPQDKPRYLMGVGEPEDMIRAVAQGVDMFDCVLPTRLGRHSVAWIGDEKRGFKSLHLRSASFSTDKKALDQNCQCPSCRNGYSRGYIHHLIKEKEILGVRLITLHNLWMVMRLFDRMRESIEKGTFAEEFNKSLPGSTSA